MQQKKTTPKARFLAALLMFCFAFCQSGQANAASGLAEVYLHSHPAITSNGTLNPIDNTFARSNRNSWLNSMGYSVGDYTNAAAGPKTSSSVIRTLADDSICVIAGHAGPGRICLVKNSAITRLTANTTSPSYNYSLQSNFSGSSALGKLKFIHYAGCDTYGTDATYGNLTTKTLALGAKSVLTHTEQTFGNEVALFDAYICYYAARGYNILDSVSYSAIATCDYFRDTDNALSSVQTHLGGNASIYLN